jgi:hypothetical protein
VVDFQLSISGGFCPSTEEISASKLGRADQADDREEVFRWATVK